MKLRIKEQFKNCGIDSRKFGKIKLSEMKEEDYKYYYDNGLKNFFEYDISEEEVVEVPVRKRKVKIKEENIDLTMDIKCTGCEVGCDECKKDINE